MVSVLRSSRVAMCNSFLARARRRSGLKSATFLCGNGAQRPRRTMLQRTSTEIFTLCGSPPFLPSTYSGAYNRSVVRT